MEGQLGWVHNVGGCCSHLELAHVGVARHAAHLDAGRAAGGERIGAEKALDRDGEVQHTRGRSDAASGFRGRFVPPARGLKRATGRKTVVHGISSGLHL